MRLAEGEIDHEGRRHPSWPTRVIDPNIIRSKFSPIGENVKSRSYDRTRRQAASKRTRARIVDAARSYVREAAPLRAGLSIAQAADIVWTLNSTAVYLLLTEGRGWTPDEYERWLGDTWARLLLD